MGEHFGGNDSSTGRRAGGTGRRLPDAGTERDCLRAVLAYPRRRHVLEVLTERGVATTADVATHVAAREFGIPPREVTDQQHHDVAISLYHVHVPKLADLGVITVGEGTDRLRPGPDAESILETVARLSSGQEPGGEPAPPDA